MFVSESALVVCNVGSFMSRRIALVASGSATLQNFGASVLGKATGNAVSLAPGAVDASAVGIAIAQTPADAHTVVTRGTPGANAALYKDVKTLFVRAKYVELGLYQRDPFQSLDQGGVGELVRIAVVKGRSVNPVLKCGVCGEHGGDPTSIEFFHRVGLNYVSCSPYRVPVAIVAAARAAIAEKRQLASERAKLASKAASKL